MSVREAVYTHACTHIHFGRGFASSLHLYITHPRTNISIPEDAEMLVRRETSFRTIGAIFIAIIPNVIICKSYYNLIVEIRPRGTSNEATPLICQCNLCAAFLCASFSGVIILGYFIMFRETNILAYPIIAAIKTPNHKECCNYFLEESTSECGMTRPGLTRQQTPLIKCNPIFCSFTFSDSLPLFNSKKTYSNSENISLVMHSIFYNSAAASH